MSTDTDQVGEYLREHPGAAAAALHDPLAAARLHWLRATITATDKALTEVGAHTDLRDRVIESVLAATVGDLQARCGAACAVRRGLDTRRAVVLISDVPREAFQVLRGQRPATPGLAEQARHALEVKDRPGGFGDPEVLAGLTRMGAELVLECRSRAPVGPGLPASGAWLSREDGERLAWALLTAGMSYEVTADGGGYRVEWDEADGVVPGGPRRRLTLFNRDEMIEWCGGRAPEDRGSDVMLVGPPGEQPGVVILGDLVEHTAPRRFRAFTVVWRLGPVELGLVRAEWTVEPSCSGGTVTGTVCLNVNPAGTAPEWGGP
jgi:hypothetical protein